MGLLDFRWMSLERGGVSAMNEQGQLEAVVGQFRRQLNEGRNRAETME